LQVAFTTLGRDEETDEELRERLMLLLSGSGNSGNRGDFVRWMEEIAIVAEAYAYGAMRNSLSIDGVIFGTSTTPGNRWAPAASDATAVENYINGTATTDGQRAVGQDFDCVLPTAQDQAVSVTLDSDGGYGRDWGDLATTSFPNANILSIDSSGLIIVVDADPTGAPYNMVVGDMLGINIRTASSATHYHLEVATITNIVAVGPNWELHLDTVLTSTTFAADLYPAGLTTAATVTAIEGMFDSLGPADAATATRWPVVSSARPCDLNISELNRAVMDVAVEGVRRHMDTTWAAPAANVTATASVITGGVLVANTIRLTTMAIFYTNLNS